MAHYGRQTMHKNITFDEAAVAAKYIEDYFQYPMPKTAVILGSGLGQFINKVKILKTIAYKDIPHFPQSHVEGHKGNLTIVEIAPNKHALIMEGRFHYYEGYTPQQVVFPIVVFHLLGIQNLIVSNAAGGINQNFKQSDLMLINDHINFTGHNPLIGNNDSTIGQRFLDQTEPYNQDLLDIAKSVAERLNISYQEGVYIGVSGPTYETKAEIKAFGTMGADAVGMSTIFEVIVANYLGIRVLGISNITNMATGIAKEKHQHVNIVNSANQVSDIFATWVREIILCI
jgi:purine-nucleoside phosphorylase